jgi:hypothetical protein
MPVSPMNLKDLIGRKVWVKLRGELEERPGRISSVPRPVILESIQSTITASTFRIDLPSGDVLETTGVDIVRIEPNEP